MIEGCSSTNTTPVTTQSIKKLAESLSIEKTRRSTEGVLKEGAKESSSIEKMRQKLGVRLEGQKITDEGIKKAREKNREKVSNSFGGDVEAKVSRSVKALREKLVAEMKEFHALRANQRA